MNAISKLKIVRELKKDRETTLIPTIILELFQLNRTKFHIVNKLQLEVNLIKDTLFDILRW